MKCVNCKNKILMEKNGEQLFGCKVKNDNFDIHEEISCQHYISGSHFDRIRSSKDEEIAKIISDLTKEILIKFSRSVFGVEIEDICDEPIKLFEREILAALKKTS